MPKSETGLDPKESGAWLRSEIKEGSTIAGQFIWVNPNGTTRIYVFYAANNSVPFRITQEIASLCGLRYRKSSSHADGIDVGSDDGTRVVQRLSQELFGAPDKLTYQRFL